MLPGSIPSRALLDYGLPDRSWLLYGLIGYLSGEIVHKTSILKNIIEDFSPLKNIIDIFSKLN